MVRPHRLNRCLSISLAAVLTWCCAPIRAATPEQIETAIANGRRFLLNAQNAQGSWDPPTPVAGDHVTGVNWAGTSALATYALLASGEDPNSQKMQAAIEFLRRSDAMTGFYAIGMRAQVWRFLPENTSNAAAFERDRRLLARGLSTAQENFGLYDYQIDGKRIDLSVSQYGVLGMWSVANAPIRYELAVPKGYWQVVEQAWLAYQNQTQGPDFGAWAYAGRPSERHPFAPSITAAGVATLFITQDYLRSDEGLNCRGNVSNKAIEAGITYLANNFGKIVADGPFEYRLYTLYGIERIGVASGLKYLGQVDWFQVGADYLVKTQNKSTGSWGSGVDTSFALLFLSRGREPVMINKLQYNTTNRQGNDPKEAFWNQRPREVANATKFVAAETERNLNWQIINLGVSTVRDLHDAPIAWLSGSQAINLSAKDRQKLKQYVEEGGMLVFHADCNKREFSEAARRILESPDMFGPLKLQPLVATHPALANQQFNARQFKRPVNARAIDNGVRLLAVVIDEDVGRVFQANQTNRSEAFQFVANLYQYSIDKEFAKTKGQTHWVSADVTLPASKTIRVARLRYGETQTSSTQPAPRALAPSAPAGGPVKTGEANNWNPEPGGWRRLDAVLRTQSTIAVEATPVDLATGSLTGFNIAHLTGTESIKFSAAASTQLKQFIDGGGTLVVDAAGGSASFDESAKSELARVFGKNFDPIPDNSPLLTAKAGSKPIEFRFRTHALKVHGPVRGNQLQAITINNRPAIIFSRYDISAGLVGNEVDGIVGYSPQVATQLMTRLLTSIDATTGAIPPAPR